MGVGVRNNNPGCIRSGRGYAKYATLEEGYLALNSLLYRRYDCMTLREMFAIYAPSGDGNNNPSLYARNVLAYLRSKGYDIDFNTRLDFSDPEFRAAMTMAISKQENGRVLGGEALALKAARSYNPATDKRQKYSETAARRARYGRNRVPVNTATPVQNTDLSKLPGIIQLIQRAASGAHCSLNDILRTAGSSVAQTGNSDQNRNGNSRTG